MKWSVRTRDVSFRSTTRDGITTEAVFVDTHKRGLMAWVTTGWLIALLIALALTLYSYLAAFIPSAHWLELAQLPACMLAIALSVPLLVFAPRMQFKRARDRVTWYASGILTVPILVYVLWQGLLLGLPAAGHHFFSATDAVQIHVVDARASHYYRYHVKFGRCTGRIYLASDVRFLMIRACGIAESDWRRVKAGDQIELHGTASWFGLKYSTFRALW